MWPRGVAGDGAVHMAGEAAPSRIRRPVLRFGLPGITVDMESGMSETKESVTGARLKSGEAAPAVWAPLTHRVLRSLWLEDNASPLAPDLYAAVDIPFAVRVA